MYPLLLAIGLILYGSLYPWHFTAGHVNPWLVLTHSWPPQWNEFAVQDAYVNIGGYVPFGVMAFLAWARRHSAPAAAATAIFAGLLLSLSMELLQVYVPGRISSLFDVTCNVTGASMGALAAWHFRKPGFRRYAMPPVLMLCGAAGYHFYPFIPSIHFARVRYELMTWLHPDSVSLIEVWSWTAEWLAVGMALQGLFGRVRLRWLMMALAFHFAARPIVDSIPFVLEDALGAILAALLWKTLPEAVRSGPWLLISVVLLRECAPLHWTAAGPAFSWIPFQTLLSSDRSAAVILLLRATFDYTAILWLWRSRGLSYEKAGVMLAGGLAVLAVMQDYIPGDVLSMTDPVVVLLLALWFRSIDRVRV